MPPARPHFPPEALTFLRALARHNDREWFRARKDQYEDAVRGPMVAVVGQLDRDFRAFAPDLVASPRVSLYRVYRDTRFSEDKSPLKTHIAAHFPHRALPRNESPGLYVEVNPKTVLVAAGLYAPTSPQLQAVRAHLSRNLARFRSIVEAPGFRRITGGLQGDRLQRLPRGFSKEDPAADYLRYRQFLVWREFPSRLATTPPFYSTLLTVFRHAAPLVGFLCEPLLRHHAPSTTRPRSGESHDDLRRRP
jgi:uncharacterized protein (TIGR02453 family)